MKELEAKYLLIHTKQGSKPEKLLRRVIQDLVWAGFRARPKGTHLIEDTYFDTDDRRLEHVGWSLRCRSLDGRRQLTSKQLGHANGGVFERREIQQDVYPSLGESLALADIGNGPVLDLLHRYLPPDAILLPLLSLNNQRRVYLLSHEDYPRSLIELAVDRVEIPDVDDPGYTELEAELKQGPPALLADACEVLNVQPALIASRVSKFQRGLLATGWPPIRTPVNSAHASAQSISPNDPLAALVVNYLAEQLEIIRHFEPFAYEGIHPEGVHQMRVATRRFRACCEAVQSHLPSDFPAELPSQIRRLGSVLGKVRDQDVQIEHLRLCRGWVAPSRHSALDTYREQLASKQQAAHLRLTLALDGGPYATLVRDFQNFVNHPNNHTRATPSISAFAQRFLPAQLRAVRRTGRAIGRKSKPRDLHRLRIHLKRLRYQLEFLSDPYGRTLIKPSKPLERLQNTLGDYQDACMAQVVLDHYRQHLDRRRDQRTFEKLIELEALHAAQARQQFARRWTRFDREARILKRLI